MSIIGITTLYSGSSLIPPGFYVDSRDAVDDGSGNCASVVDRISGITFTGGIRTSGVKPLIDTALIPGVKLLNFNNIRSNLIYVGDLGFGRDDVAQSFVIRVRRSSATTGWIFATQEAGAGSPNLGRIEIQSNSTTAIRTNWARTAGAAGHNQDTTTTWANNTWYTIGISYNGTSCRVFKDGVFLQEFTPTGLGANNNLGTHTETSLGNRGPSTTSSPSSSQLGYYAGWKGWPGVAISDGQHAVEHTLFSWAA